MPSWTGNRKNKNYKSFYPNPVWFNLRKKKQNPRRGVSAWSYMENPVVVTWDSKLHRLPSLLALLTLICLMNCIPGNPLSGACYLRCFGTFLFKFRQSRCLKRDSQICKYHRSILWLESSCHVVLKWVPNHAGIYRNEMAKNWRGRNQAFLSVSPKLVRGLAPSVLNCGP